MAVARLTTSSPPLTFEDYMTEGEVFARYDIINGVRIVTDPARRHQRILGRMFRLIQDSVDAANYGEVFLAPCDVLIQRSPLRTRQPDLLIISHERLTQNPPETDAAPLIVAPELVVEILSPSETRRTRAEKIAEYAAVGVQECWVVNLDNRTVEVLSLSSPSADVVASYGAGEVVVSRVFPDLTVTVDGIFGV